MDWVHAHSSRSIVHFISKWAVCLNLTRTSLMELSSDLVLEGTIALDSKIFSSWGSRGHWAFSAAVEVRMFWSFALSVGYISNRWFGPAFWHFDGGLGRVARIHGEHILGRNALLVVRSAGRTFVIVIKRSGLFDVLPGGASVVLVYHVYN